MKGWRERDTIRLLHLVLSVPILGFLYGPVAHIPRAAWFTRWIAVPVVLASGLWLWLKPNVMQRLRKRTPPSVAEFPRHSTAISIRDSQAARASRAYGMK
jgi:hypothetical protein